MATYGMHSLSHSSSQPGHGASGQGFGAGHWYGSSTSHPRCYEPTSYINLGGPSAGGGYGSCGGPSSYGMLSCRNTSGGPGTCGGPSTYGGGYGGPGGYGSPGGPGGSVSWCTPRSYSSPQWGSSWGN